MVTELGTAKTTVVSTDSDGDLLGTRSGLSISADGSRVAFTNPDGGWVRDLGSGELTALGRGRVPGSTGLDTIALSDDGRRVAYSGRLREEGRTGYPEPRVWVEDLRTGNIWPGGAGRTIDWPARRAPRPSRPAGGTWPSRRRATAGPPPTARARSTSTSAGSGDDLARRVLSPLEIEQLGEAVGLAFPRPVPEHPAPPALPHPPRALRVGEQLDHPRAHLPG
jgi:hypothetical protein